MTKNGAPGGAPSSFPGLRGVALWAMVLVLVLGVVPEATSFAVIKGVIFLALPALAWLSAPGILGRAMGSELSRLSGWITLVLLGWIGYGESLLLPDKGVPFEQLAYVVAGWVLLVWLRSFQDEELEYVLRWCLPIAAVLVGTTVLLQSFPQPGMSWLCFPVGEPPPGTLGNRNQVAYFLAFCLPDAFGLVASEGFLAALLGGLGALFGLAGMVLTGSRGAWLALVFAGAVRFLVSASPGQRRWVPFTFGVILLAAALAPAGMWRFQKQLGELLSPAQMSTVRTRLFAWENTLEGIRQGEWAGHGPGSFARVYPKLKSDRLKAVPDDQFVALAQSSRVKRQAHHEVLELALEWGGIGLALFSLLVLTWFFGGIQSLDGVARPGTRKRRRLGMALVAMAVVAMGFHPSFQAPVLAFMSLLGLARFLGPYRDTVLRSGLWSVPTLVLVLGCLAAAGRLGVSEFFLEDGLRASRQGRHDEAIEALRQAWKIRKDGRAYNESGRIMLAQGKIQDAINLFQVAEERDPTTGHSTNLGIARFLQGDMDGAKEALLRAWFCQPDQETGFRLGVLFEHQKALQDAEAIYRRSRALSGFTGRPGYCLARLLWETGRKEEAARTLVEVIEQANAALRSPSPQLALIARMRLASMRLLLRIQEERKDVAGITAARAYLQEYAADVDLGRLGPPGAKEVLS